jgi:hypothetical protein
MLESVVVVLEVLIPRFQACQVFEGTLEKSDSNLR